MKLTKKELTLIREIAERPNPTVTELASSTNTSLPVTSRALRSLEEKGLTRATKSGTTKNVSLAETKHATILRRQILQNPHMSLEPLSNTGIRILAAINCMNLRDWEEIQSHAGVSYHALRPKMNRFTAIGLIIKEKSYMINPRFIHIKEFIESFQEYLQTKKATESAEDAYIKWGCGETYIFETESQLGLTATGLSAFPMYGARFITLKNLYIQTPMKTLTLEDHLINHILSEKTGNILPLLITWRLNIECLDTEYIKEKAYRLKISSITDAVINYLDSRGRKRADYLPDWTDFKARYREYSHE
ncbi:MarR family transcriptional regulator [Candidatus Bathyarchaeota archaeon]|nr:MarR family transcriptional regulator [Candidatus Bathyarchaeota archaeon]